jgi:hypothetical protein
MSIINNTDPSESFQEGIIKDSLDRAKNFANTMKPTSLKDAGNKVTKVASNVSEIDKELKLHKNDRSSIIARAKNSVLQFPIYISDSIRINEAQTISKLFERVYATLVQTVLSQSPYIDEEDVNNLVFLKQFHTNLKEAATSFYNEYYNPIDELDRMMVESVFYSTQVNENLSVEFRVIPTVDQDLILENDRLLNDPLTGIFVFHEKTGDNSKTSKEDDDKDKRKRTEVKSKIPDVIIHDDEFTVIANEWNKAHKNDEGFSPRDKDSIKESIRKGNNIEHGHGRIYWRKNDQGRDEYYTKGKKIIDTKEDKPDKSPEALVDAPRLLKDMDIKKINSMLPYTIEATFRVRLTGKNIDQDIKFLIGVKSVLHKITPADLATELREIITGNIHSLQKVRYKTGELNFKDYFFNIKGLKADAAKHINYNKRWMNTLKRLGDYNKMHGSALNRGITAITGGHVPIPNGTIVLTKLNVDDLKHRTGIDLSTVENAKRLAKSLFLIAVVIIDPNKGTMNVLFPDSDNDWDIQSLGSIDSEVSKMDNSALLKELQKAINR